MIRRAGQRAPWGAVAVVLGLVACLATPSVAADLRSMDTSLRFVPADAAVYTSLCNTKLLIERARASQAWAEVLNSPLVRDLLAAYEAAGAEPVAGDEPGDTFDPEMLEGLAQMKAFLENPQTKIALATVSDMLGHDVFFMAGSDTVDVLDLTQKLQNHVNAGLVAAETSDVYDGYSQAELQAALMLDALDTNLDLLQTPQILMGFKVEDTQRAQLQVNTLTGLLAILCMTDQRLGHALGEMNVGDSRFVTFTVHGGMIPWDELPLNEFQDVELEEGQADRVLTKLKEMRVCVAMGVHEGYLMIAIDDSADFLKTLGQGDLLIDRAEIAPLAEFADQTLLGIGYVSQEFVARIGTGEKDIVQLQTMIEAFLANSDDIDDATREELAQDMDVVADYLKSLLPKPAAFFGFSMLTDKGIDERYYSYGAASPGLGGRPLTILSHAGGSPVLLAASQIDCTVDDYDRFSRLVDIGLKYFDRFVPAEMSEKERDKYDRFVEGFMPLLRKLDATNREVLVPSLQGGQMAVVVDNELRSQQFCPVMPVAEKPLPIFEPALVLVLEDTAPLKKVTDVYIDVAKKMIKMLQNIEPEEFALVQLPETQVERTELGDMIKLVPPPLLSGLDEQIQPNAAANETTAVLSLSVAHSERILRETPLAVGTVASSGPVHAGAVVLDWAAMLDTISPWAYWAIESNMEPQVDIVGRKYTREEMMQQIDAVVRLLKTMRSITVTTTIEDGVTVTHSLTIFEDTK